MDIHAIEYFCAYSDETPHGHFHEVITLHENPDLSWKEIHKKAPKLCKGWFELSKLSNRDRIDFTRDFWNSKIPYRPQLSEALSRFFSALDTIGLYLTKQKEDESFIPQMVYSFKEDGGFYHGQCPMVESELSTLRKSFADFILPKDYLAFLEIHNGFAKLTDSGIFSSSDMPMQYQLFQALLAKEEEPLTTTRGVSVDPSSLIPFYKSFDMPFFQCFWKEWYPDDEMGTVYYSGVNHTISNPNSEDSAESMAFETFTDWLMFYIEKIN